MGLDAHCRCQNTLSNIGIKKPYCQSQNIINDGYLGDI
ncbi:Unknown protein sequence [Pseudomonas syringae pv. maculicola]|nr:Unknown protein sequence [Pseudomonas syringae pv. maculicola]